MGGRLEFSYKVRPVVCWILQAVRPAAACGSFWKGVDGKASGSTVTLAVVLAGGSKAASGVKAASGKAASGMAASGVAPRHRQHRHASCRRH